MNHSSLKSRIEDHATNKDDGALTTLKAAIKWISKEGRGTGVQAIAKRIGIACVVYCLWKHRNTRMFEGKVTHPSSMIRDIKIQINRAVQRICPEFKDL
ncbi:hypothetical protein Acr_24g0009230 [Actinidia rufa]|uniref:Uncharacterized protein n=1 Tax=Actinidia rufa TaxID=165716 RepID=A0A7J0GVB2_9ERIC|nr:hypothetical protein Acr_24g0009230 [Actinidia rufa]